MTEKEWLTELRELGSLLILRDKIKDTGSPLAVQALDFLFELQKQNRPKGISLEACLNRLAKDHRLSPRQLINHYIQLYNN